MNVGGAPNGAAVALAATTSIEAHQTITRWSEDGLWTELFGHTHGSESYLLPWRTFAPWLEAKLNGAST